MADDDPWREPFLKPTVMPRAGESLWVFRKDERTWSARLLYHSEYGVETQILRDGDLIIGRRFDLREQAVEWAAAERLELGAGLNDGRG